MPTHLARLLIPLIVLLVAGGALWYVLTRPTPSLPPTPGIGTQAEAKERIEERGEYYDIEASYPGTTALLATAGIKADADASKMMRVAIENDIALFKADNRLEALTPEDIEIMNLVDGRRFAYGAEYRTYTSPTTVSYLFDVYVDTLGAHPNGFQRSFTFDATTGELLPINSLFLPNTAYLDTLSERSREFLKDVLGPDTAVDMLEAGTLPTEANFQTFYLDGPLLVLVFSPYQVGPWAIGTQTVSISRTDLADILKETYR